MKRQLTGVFVALLVAAVVLTAVISVKICLDIGDGLSLTRGVIYLCAAIIATGTALWITLSSSATGPFNPDASERPAYPELSALYNRIDEQKTLLRDRREQMEDRERKLSAITENMAEGLLLMDGAGVVMLMNNTAANLLGCDAQRAVGRHICTACADNRLQAAVHSALGGITHAETMPLGGMKLRLTANPVVVDGAAHGAVLMLRDVTEHAAAEEMRREFSANVSHELKTPMTSISGYAEMMMNGMVRQQDIPELAGRVYREAGRLLDLTNDIIKLSRLDEDEYERQPQPVELLSSAREAAQRLASCAESYGVTVSVTGSEATVLGDAALIDEMLMNLADNAIKYNRPGGHVLITVKQTDGVASVTVADDGIGIAPEELDRVFERFYRVDKSRSKQTGGTGLGLSIVKHAAAWHKATMVVASIVDEGTEITIKFDGKGGQ